LTGTAGISGRYQQTYR